MPLAEIYVSLPKNNAHSLKECHPEWSVVSKRFI
jgi:hypothetical protein